MNGGTAYGPGLQLSWAHGRAPRGRWARPLILHSRDIAGPVGGQLERGRATAPLTCPQGGAAVPVLWPTATPGATCGSPKMLPGQILTAFWWLSDPSSQARTTGASVRESFSDPNGASILEEVISASRRGCVDRWADGVRLSIAAITPFVLPGRRTATRAQNARVPRVCCCCVSRRRRRRAFPDPLLQRQSHHVRPATTISS